LIRSTSASIAASSASSGFRDRGRDDPAGAGRAVQGEGADVHRELLLPHEAFEKRGSVRSSTKLSRSTASPSGKRSDGMR
jgi:hypothetical protein